MASAAGGGLLRDVQERRALGLAEVQAHLHTHTHTRTKFLASAVVIPIDWPVFLPYEFWSVPLTLGAALAPNGM